MPGFPSRRFVPTALVVAALAATRADAQAVYTSRDAFLAALLASQTYTAAPYCANCPGNPPPSAYPIQVPSAGALQVTEGALWVYLPIDPVHNYGGGPVFGFNVSAPSGAANSVTFLSPTPIHAFGVDFGEPDLPSVIPHSMLTFTLGSGGTFTRVAQGSGSPPPPPPPLAFEFFGVISPTPFDRFTISATNPESGGLLNRVSFDAITVGVVPEPTTVALVASGLAALGGLARRRRTRR